jgi:hypothetical protein
VAFAQNEDMIEALAPDRADEPLREGHLPRAVGRGQDFGDPHALHALPEGGAVDRVAIAEEVRRRGVVREGVHDLLGRPGGGGMFRHVEVEDAAAVVGKYDEDEEDAQLSGRNGEDVDRDEVADIGQDGSPSLRRGEGRLGMSREMVRSAASMPSFGTSAWILGVPQRGFAAAIFLTRALRSGLMGGRPPVGRPERLVQARGTGAATEGQCRGSRSRGAASSRPGAPAG